MTEKSPMSAQKALETYFLDNRARLLDIASFLDRVDRYDDAEKAKQDFRYTSFIKAIQRILESEKDKTKQVQMVFSDMSSEPIDRVTDPKAYGASEK